MSQKQDTRFQPGRSGNPTGRPKGARNRATVAVEALLDGQAEALTQKAIDAALAGDTTALRLCLDRICPPKKSRTVCIDMPKTETAADLLNGLSSVLDAAASGEITVGEAQAMASILEAKRRAIETENLEARVSNLESISR